MQGLIIMGTMVLFQELVIIRETQSVALKSCRQKQLSAVVCSGVVTLVTESKESAKLGVEPVSGRWMWNLDRS